jgi:hypothetical protein
MTLSVARLELGASPSPPLLLPAVLLLLLLLLLVWMSTPPPGIFGVLGSPDNVILVSFSDPPCRMKCSLPAGLPSAAAMGGNSTVGLLLAALPVTHNASLALRVAVAIVYFPGPSV